jgi:hypothetical protein
MSEAMLNDAVQVLCDTCRSPITVDSKFCGTCGNAIAAPVAEASAGPPALVLAPERIDPVAPEGRTGSDGPTATAPAPVTRRLTRDRVLAGALALAVVAAGVVTYDDVRHRGTLDRTRRQLAATRSELASTVARLDSTAATLDSTQIDLTSTRADLSASNKTLSTLRGQLSGVRNTLSDAKGKLNVQASQIVTLKSCLNGVTIALGDVAYGDYSGAVSALDAVRVSCQAASRIVA